MNLFGKLTAAITSLSVCIVPFVSPAADISAGAAYVYDSTISDDCKDPMENSEPYNVFEIYDAFCELESINVEPEPVYDPHLKKPLLGIDISQFQGDIDWQFMVDTKQVDFAIIRAGYGKYASQTDTRFHENMKKAQEAGMDVGIYWFSYAMSVEEAREEAYACLEVIDGYSFTYPIYYDFEYDQALHNLHPSVLTAMVCEFCSVLEEHGYYTGVYGSGSYLESHIYDNAYENRAVWVAEVNTPNVKYYTGDYGIWQYSWKGTVPGIADNLDVDLDYCYYDYPGTIGANPKGSSVPVTTMPVQEATEPATTTVATTPASEITTLSRGYMIEDTTSLYDWASFDKSVHQYAMLVAQPWQDFETLKANIDAAHSYGIDCGILYLAEDANEVSVKENAERLYNALKDEKLEYPVYYWMNKSDLSGYGISEAQHSVNIEAFCSYMESKSFFSGVTAYDEVLCDKLDKDVLKKYTVWLFNEKGTDRKYSDAIGMESEWNDAIGGFIHYSCKNFPDIMKSSGLNGYKK